MDPNNVIISQYARRWIVYYTIDTLNSALNAGKIPKDVRIKGAFKDGLLWLSSTQLDPLPAKASEWMDANRIQRIHVVMGSAHIYYRAKLDPETLSLAEAHSRKASIYFKYGDALITWVERRELTSEEREILGI